MSLNAFIIEPKGLVLLFIKFLNCATIVFVENNKGISECLK